VEFPASSHDAFAAAVTAVGRFPKMAVRAAEESVGLIVVVKAIGFRSFGEVILIKLSEAGPNRTSAWVWSESFQIYDPFRVNRSNVASMIDAIRQELGPGRPTSGAEPGRGP
jgi:hypothetical protein